VRLASFLIPPVAAIVLLYQALASLQIALAHPATLLVAGSVLAVAIGLGALAAFGGDKARVGVFTVTTVVLVDMTGHSPTLLSRLTPEVRVVKARDRQRVADLESIRAALERYIATIGPPPRPADYGEGTGFPTFWDGWWDLSSDDHNGDGRPFMSFLSDSGVVTRVPVDPINRSDSSTIPTMGHQYVYFVVPPHYGYEGGVCPAAEGRGMYLLAATALETDEASARRPAAGSGCECLWRDKPDFFRMHFDYLTCGTFPG
jgi:hypothetical protein